MRSIERKVQSAQRASSSIPLSYNEALKEDILADTVRHPAAPVEITYQTALYTEAGLARKHARVMVDFPDVTKATDGTDIPIMQYELWGRDDSTNYLEATTSAVAGLAAPGLTFPGLAATQEQQDKAAAAISPWKFLSASPLSTLTHTGLIPGSVWTFMVRALGRYTTAPGDWSAEFQVQMTDDTTPPPQPTAPELTASGGVITVKWNGLSTNGAMPADFDHLVVAAGTASSPTTPVATFYRGGGLTAISGLEYYVPHFVRFQAVDQSGNRSPWSEQSSAYTAPLVDTDVILSEIDANKTIIRNLSGETLSEDLAASLEQASSDATLALGAAAQQQQRIDNEVFPAISDAAASPVTNSRLIGDSLTVWPFKANTIPAGALAPGAVGANEIADFSVAVTKLKSNRHHLY